MPLTEPMTTPKIFIELDPARIGSAARRSSRLDNLRYSAGKLLLPPLVRRGTWDLRSYPVTEFPAYRFMQRAVACDWDPQQVRDILADYNRAKGNPSRNSVDGLPPEWYVKLTIERCRPVAESMAREGYLAGAGRDEIGVAIGRDGRFVKVANGNHRFGMALLLGLPRIVVEVRAVHVRWYRATSGLGAPSSLARIRARLLDEGHSVLPALPAAGAG